MSRHRAVARQVCPYHPMEDYAGTFISDEVGWTFNCPLTAGHPTKGPYAWVEPVEDFGSPSDALPAVAEEMGLADKLPAAMHAVHPGRAMEYGVVEHAFAVTYPDDWNELVDKYGHRSRAHGDYTVSAFLGRTLGALGRRGAVIYRDGPATGRWKYNSRISWWALAESDWDRRLSWEDSGLDVSYVPGQTEIPA